MRYSRKRTTKHQQIEITYKTNEQIKAPEVRVIDDQGEPLGVMETSKAIALAIGKDLMLVEVSPKANPPVTKIMDYGKLQYQKHKQAAKQKAQQKKAETKGIKLSFKIGKNDMNIRKKQAEKFLKEGNKVKIELNLRGREKQHKNFAFGMMTNFLEELKEEVEGLVIEESVKYKGQGYSSVISKK
jgi:translation initiation factor IF-3